MVNKYEILKEIYGYDTFRVGQEALIDSTLNQKDVLGIMPTGAGKSICFQVPALSFEGVSIIISPLISLMKDQVMALVGVGVRAAYLNSSLTEGQFRKVMENARQGMYKIIYVAPERLMTESFLSLITVLNISMVAVDEAHCISQWGQDFRPSYLKIVDFIRIFPKRPVIAAYTATATEVVRDDVIGILGLQNPTVVVTGYDRENLFFTVKKPQRKMTELLEYLEKNRNKVGIIYCNTRKTVEEVNDELLRRGYLASKYHAGLTDLERKENQEDFIYDRASIMVATNAFGMGIDKSNVRFVIHFNMPKDIESYYQEAGRAGRDGEPAECILYYSGQDVRINEFLIDKQMEKEELDYEEQQRIREKDRERLRKMTYYCFSNECLREYILGYFGENTSHYCGNCENCLTEFEEVDMREDAVSFANLVKTSGERYGINVMIDAIHGTDNAKVRQLGLDKNGFFGDLRGRTIIRIRQMVNHLLLKNYLQLTVNEYPVLKLTDEGIKLLQDKKQPETIYMKLPKEQARTSSKKKDSKTNIHDVKYPELFERLRMRRYEIAQKEHKPPYIIFSDKSLKEMSISLPITENQMLEINGVGAVKLEKYGSEFLTIIQAFVKEKGMN